MANIIKDVNEPCPECGAKLETRPEKTKIIGEKTNMTCIVKCPKCSFEQIISRGQIASQGQVLHILR